MLFGVKRTVLFCNLAVGFVALFAASALGQGLKVTPGSIKIFDSPITVNIYESVNKPKNLITFVALHHNEQVGLGVVKDAIKAKGGKLIEVVSLRDNKPERFVYFRRKDSTGKERLLCVDPNRIFSRSGIINSLTTITGRGCENNLDAKAMAVVRETAVVDEIERFQTELFKMFDPKDRKNEVVVAVHNNTNNPDDKTGGISIKSFIKLGDDEYFNNEAAYIVQREDPDDFIMVSNNFLFKTLISDAPGVNQFSIAIQRQLPEESKGFLSTKCGRLKINYVIVEAEHNFEGGGVNHGIRQRAMVDRLIDLFPVPAP